MKVLDVVIAELVPRLLDRCDEIVSCHWALAPDEALKMGPKCFDDVHVRGTSRIIFESLDVLSLEVVLCSAVTGGAVLKKEKVVLQQAGHGPGQTFPDVGVRGEFFALIQNNEQAKFRRNNSPDVHTTWPTRHEASGGALPIRNPLETEGVVVGVEYFFIAKRDFCPTGSRVELREGKSARGIALKSSDQRTNATSKSARPEVLGE